VVVKHQVLVDGDLGDEVIALDNWERAGDAAVSNYGQIYNNYNIYNSISPNTFAQLSVDTDIIVKNNLGVVI
jgi:hypothetical protein